MKKIAAIPRTYCPHHIDHLAPLCDLFQAPLLLAEETNLRCAKDYPNLQCNVVEFTDLHPEVLSETYDAVIHTFPWPKKMINYWIGEKNFRAIHIPHGHSDKGYYSGTLESYLYQDIVLIYGNRMQKMLHSLNLSLKEYLFMGNLRWPYYQKYKEHFDALAEEKIFSYLDPQKKTLLYAPTWNDFELSSTFFSSNQRVLEQIPKEYNLIVKIHPLLEEDNLAKVELFCALSAKEKNVVVVRDYHHIYSILQRCDIYLGDLSSIGYDFLLFDKPMFFFNPGRKKDDRSLYLHRCGTVFSDDNLLDTIKKALEKDHLFSPIRKKLYHNTFAPISPSELQTKVIALI